MKWWREKLTVAQLVCKFYSLKGCLVETKITAKFRINQLLIESVGDTV